MQIRFMANLSRRPVDGGGAGYSAVHFVGMKSCRGSWLVLSAV